MKYKVGIILACFFISISCDPDTIVTKSGPVQGITMKGYSGKDVRAFYGIPYAVPPTGNLRFAPPKAVTPWTEVFHASEKPRPCFQKMSPQIEEFLVSAKMTVEKPWTEDCLRLNIWVPSVENPKDLPVLVYIHGGSFQMGSSVHFLAEGHTLAAEEDVIVMSMNYRLDVFGFLKLPGSEAPGNVGLLDQQLALRWLQDNVASFGGDPNSVTIYGSSAGGASVGFHLLAPSSRGLFRRAISMSGVPNNIWSMRDANVAIQKANTHAESLNCSNGDPSLVLKCLRSLSPDELLGEDTDTYDTSKIFGPTVDGSFISENPSASILSGRFNDASVIFGCTSDEGKYGISYLGDGIVNKNDFSLPVTGFAQLLSKAIPILNTQEREVIKTFYVDMNSLEDPRDIRDQFSLLIGDMQFSCGINDFAHRYALAGNRVYRYVFDQTFPVPGVVSWGGADHFSDMVYFSGQGLAPLPSSPDAETNDIPKSSQNENPGAVLSRIMMKSIANFARSGDPNMEGQPTWPRYTPAKRHHLRWSLNSTVEASFRDQECQFLKKLVPRIRSLKTC